MKLVYRRYRNRSKAYLMKLINEKFLPYLKNREEMDSSAGTVDTRLNPSKNVNALDPKVLQIPVVEVLDFKVPVNELNEEIKYSDRPKQNLTIKSIFKDNVDVKNSMFRGKGKSGKSRLPKEKGIGINEFQTQLRNYMLGTIIEEPQEY